jgi:glycosyltransferase involved in cell wall biosynthesis
MDFNLIVAADPVSAFLALSAKKPDSFFVYEDLDYFEDIKTGKIRRSFISFLEKLALKKADLVISVSKPLLKRAFQLNPNCILIPNGTNLRSFSRSKEISRDPIIMYVGSIDEWAGLEIVIKAFPLIKKKFPGIMMKIVGDGTEKNVLKTLVERLGLQNTIFFVGKFPFDQMADFLCDSYIGLATFKPGNAAAFASPLKLFDYMAAGVPIIATDIGDIGRIVRESESGFAVQWNIEEIEAAVEQLMKQRTLWLEFHNNGLRFVEKYDWKKLFDYWLREIGNRLPNNISSIK